MLLNKPD